MSHHFVPEPTQHKPESTHHKHPTVEEETESDMQETGESNYQLFRRALDHFRKVTTEDAETTSFIPPPDVEIDPLIQIQTSIRSMTAELSKLEPQLDKLVKKTNKIARQTSDVDDFSNRLATVDTKFTRKINGLDKRIKKVVSYGNTFEQMTNQVN